ncbi:RBBP9/YdeN family alpha/beta hydrolase [Patescibacteria group bacterium]
MNNKNTKRIFILHRWGGNPKTDWYLWLKEELEKKGYKVNVPEMPNTDEPDIEEWLESLTKLVGKADTDTYFVGHSIGVQAILRYLDTLPEDAKIGGAAFVAGWHTLTGLESAEEKEIAAPWSKDDFDFAKVKTILNKSHALFSSDDPFVPLENEKWFADNFGSETEIVGDKGHFDEDSGNLTSPETLEAVLKITQ